MPPSIPITDIISPFGDILGTALGLLANSWWFLLFLFLFVLFEKLWLFNKQNQYKKFPNILLEIRVPRDLQKTPQAMEFILTNLHNLRNSPGDFMETYLDGEVTMWWSFEIVSYGGEIHFYVRTPKKHKALTEAAFYANYPNVDIKEVPDYINNMPASTAELYQKDYNIFGSELILKKPDMYPIRTYKEFSLDASGDSSGYTESSSIDPMSTLIEVLGKIDKRETVCIQMLAEPADSSWMSAAKPVIKKMKEGTKVVEDGNVKYLPLSVQESETLAAMERNISKVGYRMLIRFLYLAPKAIYNTNFGRKGLLGAFNQYGSPNLNMFGTNKKVETRVQWHRYPYIFSDRRVEARKQRVLENYRTRNFPEDLLIGKLVNMSVYNFNFSQQTFILNVEELATLFHLPNKSVLTAPYFKLAESKKMTAPAGLIEEVMVD